MHTQNGLLDPDCRPTNLAALVLIIQLYPYVDIVAEARTYHTHTYTHTHTNLCVENLIYTHVHTVHVHVYIGSK